MKPLWDHDKGAYRYPPFGLRWQIHNIWRRSFTKWPCPACGFVAFGCERSSALRATRCELLQSWATDLPVKPEARMTTPETLTTEAQVVWNNDRTAYWIAPIDWIRELVK